MPIAVHEKQEIEVEASDDGDFVFVKQDSNTGGINDVIAIHIEDIEAVITAIREAGQAATGIRDNGTA